MEYVQGFFYFFANDPRTPQPLQSEVNEWGLPRDEYADTAHWPHQMYIREERRMVGEFVVTQKDLQTEHAKLDPIGMGSYNSDSHNIQRIVNARGSAENEGDMHVSGRALSDSLPRDAAQAERGRELARAGSVLGLACGLLVAADGTPVHVIGQAAGVVAKMAVDAGLPVQEINVRALTAALRRQGAVMEYAPLPQQRLFRLFRREWCGPGGKFYGIANSGTPTCP